MILLVPERYCERQPGRSPRSTTLLGLFPESIHCLMSFLTFVPQSHHCLLFAQVATKIRLLPSETTHCFLAFFFSELLK